MILKNGKAVVNSEKPYIVAELNSSHRGKVDIAKAMIDAAKECGCDAVKFQSWSADSLYCDEYYEKNPMAKRMANGVSLRQEDLLLLSDYCKDAAIDFTSTPYSKEEVDFLVNECNVPYVKIASMDINNFKFLRYIAEKQVPIVLSTGMASMKEIEAAVRIIEEANNESICILHCVSLYPVKSENVNLNNILMLQERFPKYDVGYSDHTIGYEVACAAVALGASLIEKHFTLDNKKIGWDNNMATEPDAMKDLVDKCHSVYVSLGNFDRMITDNEIIQSKKMRRSVIVSRNLVAGHILNEDDLDAKRPGDGISVGKMQSLIGRKLRTSIQKGHMLRKENLE